MHPAPNGNQLLRSRFALLSLSEQQPGLPTSVQSSHTLSLTAEFPVSCGRLHKHINSSSKGRRPSRHRHRQRQQQRPASGSGPPGGSAGEAARGDVDVTTDKASSALAGKAEGQTGKAEGQTGKAEGQTGKAEGQTGKDEGQTVKAEGQTGKAEGQTSGQPGLSIKKTQSQRDPFANAQPITAGVGLELIRRMGWREGQGLGRQGEGRTEPVPVAMRTGRAGLASQDEKPASDRRVLQPHAPPQPRPSLPPRPQQIATEQVHKPSAHDCLHRLAWLSQTYMGHWPRYRLIREVGPPGAKMYLYSVTAMHCTYQSGQFRPSRRLAKAAAAELALRHLDPGDCALPRPPAFAATKRRNRNQPAQRRSRRKEKQNNK